MGIMGSLTLFGADDPDRHPLRRVLKIVPDHLREAAYALGTPKWKVVVNELSCRRRSPDW